MLDIYLSTYMQMYIHTYAYFYLTNAEHMNKQKPHACARTYAQYNVQ